MSILCIWVEALPHAPQNAWLRGFSASQLGQWIITLLPCPACAEAGFKNSLKLPNFPPVLQRRSISQISSNRCRITSRIGMSTRAAAIRARVAGERSVSIENIVS
ncbi:MAG: hypothetical protein HPY72_07855 [Anaerolineae bacterium]|nr:hypothetical protein [Anaerolineae bacterium]